jgi:hypothetical protein
MAQAPVSPQVQKNLTLLVGTDSYEKHVSAVAWEPSIAQQEWRGGTPDAVFTDSGAPTWVANITLIQDWENPDSFFNFCLEHAGESVTAEYHPVAGGQFKITATITIVPPTIGGPVGEFVEATLAMGSTSPVPTFPVDVAAAKTKAAKAA